MGGKMKKESVIFGSDNARQKLATFQLEDALTEVRRLAGHTNILKESEILNGIREAKQRKDLRDAYVKVGVVKKELVLRIKKEGLIDTEVDFTLIKNWQNDVDAFTYLNTEINGLTETLKSMQERMRKQQLRIDKAEIDNPLKNEWEQRLQDTRREVLELRKAIDHARNGVTPRADFENLHREAGRFVVQYMDRLQKLDEDIKDALPTEEEQWAQVVVPTMAAYINELLSSSETAYSRFVIMKGGALDSQLGKVRQLHLREYDPLKAKPTAKHRKDLDMLTGACVDLAVELARSQAEDAIQKKADNAFFTYQPIDDEPKPKKKKSVQLGVDDNPADFNNDLKVQENFNLLADRLKTKKADPAGFVKILTRGGLAVFPHHRSIITVFESKRFSAAAGGILRIAEKKPVNRNDLLRMGQDLEEIFDNELPPEAGVLLQAFRETYPDIVEQLVNS